MQKNPKLLEQKKHIDALAVTIKNKRLEFTKRVIKKSLRYGYYGAYAPKSHISSIPQDVMAELNSHFTKGETETLDKILIAPLPAKQPKPPFHYLKDKDH